MHTTSNPQRRREARHRIRVARAMASEFLEERKAQLRRDLERRSTDLAGHEPAPDPAA